MLLSDVRHKVPTATLLTQSGFPRIHSAGREMEDQRQEEQTEKKKSSITIPSLQDVFHDAAPSSSSSTTLPCTNSDSHNPSFSQAFSFIKSSEFYTPPLPPPPTSDKSPRHAGAQPEGSAMVASSSSSASPSPSGQNRNAILVSHRQKGNPLLKHIRNVRWVFADVICDYLLGQSSCAVYLSLRYHLLHPDYLYYRIRELQKNFKLRVVLCHVDVEDVVKPLLEVTRMALLHDCTLLCGWSLEECGRYLETIKVYENKSADNIREQMDTDYLSRLTHALTAIRRVNKTDVLTLGSAFGSLSGVMDASMEELARCPGIGERKVKRLHDTFHEPFRCVSARPTAVSDAPSEDKNTEYISVMDDGVQYPKEKVTSPKPAKEASVTVRSALATAFAKHANKVHKKEGKNFSTEQGEGSNAVAADKETTSE